VNATPTIFTNTHKAKAVSTVKGSGKFGCIPRSNSRQIIVTIIGESLVFLFGIVGYSALLLVEVVKGENFGFLPNLFLIFWMLVSSFSVEFSFVLLKNRELFVSSMRHVVQMESNLSNGK
jgi:hypothetical protein